MYNSLSLNDLTSATCSDSEFVTTPLGTFPPPPTERRHSDVEVKMAELLARRNANIENNRKMLLELGIGPGHQALTVPRKKPVASKKAPPKPQPKPRPVKRSADEIENDAVEGDAVSNRMIRVDEAGTRRSARNVGKPKLDYSKEISEPQVVTIAQKTRRRVRAKGGDDDDDDYDDGYDEEYEDSNGNTGNRLGKRLHNP